MAKNGKETKIWLLRLFAVSWGAMAALAAYLLAKHSPGYSLWIGPLGITAACVVGLFFPALLRRPYRLVDQLLAPVGRLLSSIVLGVVFFGVFTPFAVVLRWRGWDPLRLKRESRGASAWIDRPKASERPDYRWQY